MNVKTNDALDVHKKFLEIIGIWPLQEKSFLRRVRLIVVTFLQVSFLGQCLTELYFYQGDMSTKVDIYLTGACGILSCIKHSQMIMHRSTISMNLKSFNNDWSTYEDEISQTIMKSHKNISNLFCKVMVFSSLSAGTLFLIKAVITNVILKLNSSPDEELTIQLMVPMSFLRNDVLNQYYGVLIAFQYIQSMCVCLSSPVIDSFIFGIVSHLCGQYEILNIKWRTLYWPESDEKICYEKQQKEVFSLIRRHQHLVKMGKNLETSFTGIFFTQVFVNILFVCIAGINLLTSLGNGDWLATVINLIGVNIVTTQTFVFCYLGDYLWHKSQEVVEAVYFGLWYNFNSRLKTTMFFIMMRASSPTYLTAGKFCNMSRTTFINILKTSASYLSVLRLMFHTN